MRFTKLMMFTLALVAGLGLALAAGALDPQAAIGGAILANLAAADLQKLNDAVMAAFAKLDAKHDTTAADLQELRAQVLDLHQARATRPGGGLSGVGSPTGELAELIANSSGLKAFLGGQSPSVSIEVPTRLLVQNTVITNPPPGTSNPLTPPDRSSQISAPPLRRPTIRSLFVAIPTNSNSIEFPVESSYTNNARPQGDVSPVGNGEGELKAESALGFTLQTVPVVTLAHWVPASRQILSDSPALAQHLQARLLLGLALEEEDELLTSSGGAGEMNGINNQAAAFTGGVTNATRLDALARGAAQLAVGNYEPSAIVLNPIDWLNCLLEKDTAGRYVIGNPATAQAPSLWGLQVIATTAQAVGRFTILDPVRFGHICDRETASIRISEHHSDFFVRNLIVTLAEQRTAFVCEQPNGAVYGSITSAG